MAIWAVTDRSALEVRIAGEGLSPRDIPIGELARLLTAASSLLRTIAGERKIDAPEVALVELRAGSVALKLEASDPEADAAFATLAESMHEAVRTRGHGASSTVRSALGKLYEACRRGPLEISGHTGAAELAPVLMAQPLSVVPDKIDATSVLLGRVEGITLVRERFEVAFKPADGGSRLQLRTDKSGMAERAARLFNRSARVKVRFTRSSEGARDDWELIQITSWDPSNLVEVMAGIGQDLQSQGFEVNADRFAQSLRQDREAEDE